MQFVQKLSIALTQ